MSDDLLPIKILISNRCDELGLRPAELIRRCGYKNISKGLRRLESVHSRLLQRKRRTHPGSAFCIGSGPGLGERGRRGNAAANLRG